MILLFLFMILAANAGIAVWRCFENRRAQHDAGRIFLNILTVLLSVIDAAVIVVIAALFFAFTAPHWYLRACIIMAGVLILLFLILAGALAFRGKPFFLQPRPGRGEKIFYMLKFRSMTDKRDASGKLLPDGEHIVCAV